MHYFKREEMNISMKLTDTVTWVGKVDWDLVKFYGEEGIFYP